MINEIQHTAQQLPVGKVGPGLSHSPRGMGCHKTTILSAPKRLLTLKLSLTSIILIFKMQAGSTDVLYMYLKCNFYPKIPKIEGGKI